MFIAFLPIDEVIVLEEPELTDDLDYFEICQALPISDYS